MFLNILDCKTRSPTLLIYSTPRKGTLSMEIQVKPAVFMNASTPLHLSHVREHIVYTLLIPPNLELVTITTNISRF